MKRNIPSGWHSLEMKDFLKFTPREVKKPMDRYLSLGIRSHCKGTFIREVENPDNVMMDSLFIVKKDDLIVNITFAWEGAVALIKETDEGAFVSHRFPTYTFDRNIVIPEYFKYLIPSKRFIYELGIISPGGAGRNRVLNRKDFIHLQFIMPPIEEQKKIADIFLTWDRAIATLENLIDIKIKFNKGLMQKLLNNCSSKKFILKDVAKIISSNVDKKAYENQKQILLCNYLEVYKNSYITRKLSFMNATASDSEINRFSLNEDDVVITKDSENPEDIGVSAVVTEKLQGVVCGYHLAIIRIDKSKINPIYFAKTIMSAKVKKQFYKYANGVTRFGLSISDVGKIEFFAPNIAEQKKIAFLLKALDKEIMLLGFKLDFLRNQKKGLTQKLLNGRIRVRV